MWLVCDYLYYMYMYISLKCIYVCTCVCIHVHVCHICIVCHGHEFIDTCIHLFVVHLSRHHLARHQQRRWQYQRLEIFVWESRGNWGSWTSWSFCSFWEPQVLSTKSSDIPVTLGRKNRVCCLGGKKKREFETKGVDLSPPGGTQPEWEGNGN
jgi:hypothetical protein